MLWHINWVNLLVGLILLAAQATTSTLAAPPDRNLVGNPHIKNNAVTTGKIQEGAVRTRDIRNSAVTFEKLASDAVHLTTIVVSPAGGDPAANCALLLDAVESAADADGETPYLLLVEPGHYVCQDRRVALRPYVSLHGSGSKLTFISGYHDGLKGVVTLPTTPPSREPSDHRETPFASGYVAGDGGARK